MTASFRWTERGSALLGETQPGSFHLLLGHSQVAEHQQQEPLGAARIGGCTHACGLSLRRPLRRLLALYWRGLQLGRQLQLHEGQQVIAAQLRPTTKLFLTTEAFQLRDSHRFQVETRRQQESGCFRQQQLLAIVQAMGLALQIVVQTPGVIGEDRSQGL